jgi:polysaccharide pyruvyl transferase CsaB
MHALLMGYYGARNVGDELMLSSLRRWLESQGVSVTVLAENATDVIERHGLPAIQNAPLCGEWSWYDAWFRGKALRIARAILAHDALIVGGGDLLRDDKGWRQFLYSMEKIFLALIARRPVYLINVGLGAPQTWYGRAILHWALRRCSRIIVRDVRSLRVCADAGALANTDMAEDIVAPACRTLAAIAVQDHLGQQQPYVVVALRHGQDAFEGFEVNDENIQNLAQALDRLIDEQDVDVICMPFQSAEWGDDTTAHERIRAHMEHKSRVKHQEWTAADEEIVSLMRGASAVVAMRLHAGVIAHALGIPSLMMPYDRKIMEFAQQHESIVLADQGMLRSPERLFAALADLVASERSNAGAMRTGSGRIPLTSWADLSLGYNDGIKHAHARAAKAADAPLTS